MDNEYASSCTLIRSIYTMLINLLGYELFKGSTYQVHLWWGYGVGQVLWYKYQVEPKNTEMHPSLKTFEWLLFRSSY